MLIHTFLFTVMMLLKTVSIQNTAEDTASKRHKEALVGVIKDCLPFYAICSNDNSAYTSELG
jgi:competence protein ComGC